MKKWTDEEIEKLIEISYLYPYDKVAGILKRSPNSIYIKARRLNLPLIQSRRKWTKEEKETLKQNWGYIPVERIAYNLKRTVLAVEEKAARLHLGAKIDNNLDYITISTICGILKVPRSRVEMFQKYGLKLTKKKVSAKRFNYVTTLDKLLSFLKEHQDLWDASKVELYDLGLEEEWLKEKRKKDQLYPSEYDRSVVTKEQIDKVLLLNDCGKTVKEIISITKYKEGKIRYILTSFSKKANKKVGTFWTDEEVLFLKSNIETMTYKDIGASFIPPKTKDAVKLKAYKLKLKKGR